MNTNAALSYANFRNLSTFNERMALGWVPKSKKAALWYLYMKNKK